MNLSLDSNVLSSYKSGSQIARLVTERWAAANLYCAACDSPSLTTAATNTKAYDFACPGCGSLYQLKSGRGWSERRIPDAAYNSMIAAIRSDRTPNLLVMQYSAEWQVRNLLLIPSFFFTESAIEKRPPLSLTARRPGWVGCNILLSEIAAEGKLRIVDSGMLASPEMVRQQYTVVRPLSEIAVSSRGWLLDVLTVVHRIGRREFSLADVYQFDSELASKHPENRNVRPKIRQKLQVLRDLSLIEFLGNGRYRLH